MTDILAAGDSAPAAASQPALRRLMGPWLLLLFIIGDLLGTGIYTLTGEVADHVGGAVWLPFLVAVFVALFTALSYLELVTKYPRAAGAALYAHKAFGKEFVTFIVGFAVMCSGITSASTASRAVAANLSTAFGLEFGDFGITLAGLAFMGMIAAINFRGIGESLIMNVILTCVETTGLLIIIFIGLWAAGAGAGDLSRVIEFKTAPGSTVIWPVITATTLAFFAMVGFEDSVNMVEESTDPTGIFPKALLLGLGITAVIYVLVSMAAVTVVPPDRLAQGETPLLQVVQAGAPNFPVWIFGLITMCAVANTALLNMMMASRLVYGMAREKVLPAQLGGIHAVRRTPRVAILFTTALALLLISLVGELPMLAGTTTLLLMCVFAVVNVAVLVQRKDRVAHEHFRTPTVFPIIGVITCVLMVGPWSGRPAEQYITAAVLLALGGVLWLATRASPARSGALTASARRAAPRAASGPRGGSSPRRARAAPPNRRCARRGTRRSSPCCRRRAARRTGRGSTARGAAAYRHAP